MPLIILALGAAGIGAAGGFVLSDGVNKTGDTLKWGVIGAGIFLAGRMAKVW